MTALEKDEGRKCQIVTRMISEILPQDSNLTEIRIEYHLFFLRPGRFRTYKLSNRLPSCQSENQIP